MLKYTENVYGRNKATLRELDLLNDTNPLEEIKLCDEYARSFDELINEEAV